MTTNLKGMMDAANAAVPRITPAQAQDSSKIVHAALLLLMLEAAHADLVSPSA